MKKIIYLSLILLFFTVNLSAITNFTPTIDGIKEASWGTTPDATSSSYRSIGGAGTYHSQNACQDVYVTDDPNNLYIGYYYNGDAWNDGSGNSARIMFGFLTNTAGTSGGDSDPWESTTKFGSSNKPDFFLRQWTEAPYDERMEFGGALGSSSETKGVAEFLSWNGSAWVGTGVSVNHYERLTISGSANNWGEIAIPLNKLGIKTGDTIKLFMYYRPNPSRPGYSDSTPFDPHCSAEATNSGSSYSMDSSFSYTIQADNVEPVISSVLPAHTATGQARDGNLTFTITDNLAFGNDKINVIVEGNDAIKNGVFQTGYSGSITGDNTISHSVTINPAADFSYDQQINVTITVDDEAGNQKETTYYYTIAADTTDPTASSYTPADNATGVARNTIIQFTMADDDQVQMSDIAVTVGGQSAIAGGVFQAGYSGASSQITPVGSGYQITIDREADFSFSDNITVVVNGKDMSGNSLADSISFTVTADNIDPTISSQSPANGETGVVLTENISFNLGDNIQVASNTISATIGGNPAIVNGAFQSGFEGTIVVNGLGYIVTVNPTSDFVFGATVSVNITAEDSTGNSINPTWSFTTKSDDTVPVISGQTPASSATGVAKNQSVIFTITDESGINPDKINVTISGNSAVVNGNGQSGYSYSKSVVPGGYQVTVNPDSDFSYDQVVNVAVDTKDNSVNANQLVSSYSFTVAADSVNPTLSAYSPADGATAVSKNSLIQFTIDDDAQVKLSSISVSVDGQSAIAAGAFQTGYNGASSQITPTGVGYQVTIDKESDFAYLDVIAVSITGKDMANNSVADSISFTIASDVVDPTVSGESPADGVTGIGLNDNISFNLNDNVQVASNTISATIGGNPAIVNGAFQSGFSGTIGVNGSGYIVTINPNSAFVFGTSIAVNVTAEDIAGNSINPSWSFTTKNDDSVPAISGQSPAGGATGIVKAQSVVFTVTDESGINPDKINVKIGGNNAVVNGNSQSGYSYIKSPVSNPEGYQITVNPNSDFSYDQVVSVFVDVKDGSVNQNQLISSYSFTIKSDDVVPYLNSITPSVDAVGVDNAANISIGIEDETGVMNSTLVVSINGVAAYSNGVFISPYNGALSERSNPTGTGINLTIDPESLLTYSNLYTIAVTGADANGNVLSTNYSFTVEADNVNPVISALSPSHGTSGVVAETSLGFSLADDTAIDLSSVVVTVVTNSYEMIAYTNGSAQSGFAVSAVANGDNGYDFVVNPDNNFSYNETVNVKVWVSDSTGNETVNLGWVFTIQGGDIDPPIISEQNPYPGMLNSEPDALINFKTADNVGIVETSINVSIVLPSGVTNDCIVNGVFMAGYNGAGSAISSNAFKGFDVSVDGLTNFAFTNSYTVVASVRDGGGNTVEKEWTFTVRPPDTDLPIVTGLMPADTAEDVPISSSISFNVQDNYGVLSNEIAVIVNGVVAFSNGSFTADYAGGGSTLIANAQNGYSVVIDPIKDFDYSTDVNVSIAIKDTSNNSSQYNVSFKVLELKAARPVSNIISPTSGNSTIKIKINRTGYAVVKVYNIRGEVVFTIPNTYYQAGISFVEWNGTVMSSLRAVGSGYYFVRIKGSDIDTTVKVVVVK